MATFKVGMRVRRARPCAPQVPVGSTGTVSAPEYIGMCGDPCCGVRWDGLNVGEDGWACDTLEPIIDHTEDAAADAFLARMNKLGNEPINAVEKVTVTK